MIAFSRLRAAARRKAWRLAPLGLAMLASASCMNPDASAPPGNAASAPVITVMVPLHFPQEPAPALIERIEELTGTKLQIDWVHDEIYSDKMNASLTMNSLKKATFVKYTDYIVLRSAVRSGMFWEIGPYLNDYPNLRRLSADILEQTAVDGKVYGLYTERPSSRQGVILRADWLDNLGLKPPSTLDELYEALKQFARNDPDRDGLADTVGLTDRNDLVFGAFKTLGSYFGTPNNWGVEGRRIVPEFETQPYRDTMNFMRKLYDEKLINADFAVTSKDKQRDLLINGKAGVYIGSMTDVERLAEETKQADPNARFTVVNRIEGPSGYRIWSIPNYNGLFLFSKSAIKTEDELKQALAFFDRTMDADVANLMRYGVQDRHYKLVGEEVYLQDRADRQHVSEVDPLYSLMIADLGNPNIRKVAKEDPLLSLAERLSKDNEKFVVDDPTVTLESATFDEKGAELSQIVKDATYNYILGKIDEAGFEKEVARWRASGGDRIVDEFTQAYFQ